MERPLRQYGCNLVGISFRPAEEKARAKALQPGDTLYLEREPDNQYDANAVKVLDQEHAPGHLGYIERGIAESIAPWLDKGWTFHAEVVLPFEDNKVFLKLVPQEPASEPVPA